MNGHFILGWISLLSIILCVSMILDRNYRDNHYMRLIKQKTNKDIQETIDEDIEMNENMIDK